MTIVSSTFSNPTASSNLQTLLDFQNPSYGLTYSVSSSDLRYYRAYALNNTGDYSYSIGPGVLFQMEKIEFSNITKF